MARRQQLGEAQVADLFDPPTGQRELVRHYTLSGPDLAAVRRCRGDHNRLGYALMLCYLRHPGRALRAGEHPPPALLNFVAGQIDVAPDMFDGSAAAERSRQRHSVHCQERLRLRPFGRHAAAELASALLAAAIEDDRLLTLAELVLRSCREHRVVLPAPAALERLCADHRHRARREAHPRQNGVASALRELGRLERTLFTLDWIEAPDLRRTTSHELNKGETRNSLARAVFIHRLGEIRDRTYENQQHRASGLNLVVTAIILWNTRYLERAVATLRQTEHVPEHLLSHLSPLGWEQVNLTGDYIWAATRNVTENSAGLRPLRPAPDTHLKAV